MKCKSSNSEWDEGQRSRRRAGTGNDWTGMTNERQDGYNVSIKQMNPHKVRTKSLRTHIKKSRKFAIQSHLQLAVFWPFVGTLAKSGRLSAAANIFPSIAVF